MNIKKKKKKCSLVISAAKKCLGLNAQISPHKHRPSRFLLFVAQMNEFGDINQRNKSLN